MKEVKLTSSEKVQVGLDKLGITKLEDVLLHLPRTYADFKPTPETNLQPKDRVVFTCKLVSKPVFTKTFHHNLISFSVVTFNKNFFKVVAFNRSYLINVLKEGETYTIIGTYDHTRQVIALTQVVKGVIEEGHYLKPIYSLPAEIENFMYIRLVKKALLELPPSAFETQVPQALQNRYKLIPKMEALKLIHQPKVLTDVPKGTRVLKYEEAYLFAQKMKRIREENYALKKGISRQADTTKVQAFIRGLPYALTHDQQVAVDEILTDMNKPHLMYRLLQGDVGSGKTLVAALALYGNFTRREQGAFMAPTDALAKQHYRTLSKLFANTGVKVSLLVGSFTSAEKASVKEAMIDGTTDIVIGTHALFSEDVVFQSLGLVIIDEQHRFGVNQRDALHDKGERADLLLMSATPIPRTLALSVYGDMDLSTLMQFPFENRKITTVIHHPEDPEIDQAIEASLAQKKRIYVIAPMINEPRPGTYSVETLFIEYLKKYQGKVSLLHGKLPQDDKEQALKDFESGLNPIIVATTVIEVGIDVKEANLMIIYDANHFGLASLHQLRGRIGRDGSEATCILLTEDFDDESIDRLNVLVKSNDGFFIAEEDLKRRGPGELLGIRQSGLPEFAYLNIVDDFKILDIAKKDVENP